MKKWYQSKTMWINILVIGGMVAEYLLTSQIYSPEIHAIVLAAINMGLRLSTRTGIAK